MKIVTNGCSFTFGAKGNEESPEDGHPNEAGHDIIFRYIYNEIKKRWQI